MDFCIICELGQTSARKILFEESKKKYGYKRRLFIEKKLHRNQYLSKL